MRYFTNRKLRHRETDWPKVTKLLRDRAGTQSQAAWFHGVCF